MSPPERTVLFVYNSGLVAKLYGLGNFKGRSWQLGAGTFTIGREPTCDLCLEGEPGVSKVHCKITMENNQFVVVDSESRNGTLVNNQLVKRQVLKDRDELRICNVSFRFEQEFALPDRPGGPPPMPASAPPPLPSAPPPPPMAQQPPVQEMTERVSAARRKEANKAVKRPSVWPFFLAGMLLFFGMAGGALWYLGVIPPELLAQVGIPVRKVDPVIEPKEVPPDPVEAPSGTGKEPTTVASNTDKPGKGEKGEPPDDKGKGDDPPGLTTSSANDKTETPEPTPQKTPPPEKSGPPVNVSGSSDFTGQLRIVTAGGDAGGEGGVVRHSLNGKVASLNVKSGQKVKKGAVLLMYEDIDLRRRLETAREQYRALREIAEAQGTERAKKALGEARQEVSRLNDQVDALKLLAPSDGTITDVSTGPGKRVGKGTPAFKMSASGGGGKSEAVVLAVLPTDRPVQKGARAKIFADGEQLTGKVGQVEGAESGNKVTISVDEMPARAKDGASVRFRLLDK